MHSNIDGFINVSELYLTNEPSYKADTQFCYQQQRDSSLRLRSECALSDPSNEVFGNLPVGFGLAASTILAFLKFSSVETAYSYKKMIINHDYDVHGFEPSGVDFYSCLNQCSGFFSMMNGWKSIDACLDTYMLALPVKEGILSLSTVRDRVLSKAYVLEPLIKKMNFLISQDNYLEKYLFIEYCQILNELSVYSAEVTSLVRKVLELGFAAKGVGGLYDKAILIVPVSSNSQGQTTSLKQLLKEYNCELVYDAISVKSPVSA